MVKDVTDYVELKKALLEEVETIQILMYDKKNEATEELSITINVMTVILTQEMGAMTTEM